MTRRPRSALATFALAFAAAVPTAGLAHGHHDDDHDHSHGRRDEHEHSHEHARDEHGRDDRHGAHERDHAHGPARARVAQSTTHAHPRGGGPGAPNTNAGANTSANPPPAPPAMPNGNGPAAREGARPAEPREREPGDVGNELITAGAAFRAARDQAQGLATLYGTRPAVTAEMREQAEVLRHGLSRELSAAREQLDRVRTAAERVGRGDRARPDLAAVDDALAQVDRDLSTIAEKSRAGAAPDLRQRASDAVARLDEAQRALSRLATSMH